MHLHLPPAQRMDNGAMFVKRNWEINVNYKHLSKFLKCNRNIQG